LHDALAEDGLFRRGLLLKIFQIRPAEGAAEVVEMEVHISLPGLIETAEDEPADGGALGA